MYARLKIDVLKSLTLGGAVNTDALKKLNVRVAYQNKSETLTVTISDRGTPATLPMYKRMVTWYRQAPVRRIFSITEAMINNLHALKVIDKVALRAHYIITIKEVDTPKWGPIPVWFLKEVA